MPGKDEILSQASVGVKEKAVAMKPLRILVILLIAVVVISMASAVHWRHQSAPVLPTASLAFPLPLPLAGVTVILDPGHGGADSGAKCAGITEASLTYRTAVETAADLQAEGATVIYTVTSRALASNLVRTEPPLQTPRDARLSATDLPIRIRRGASPVSLWLRTHPAQTCWRKRDRSDRHSNRNLFFLSLHYDDFHLRRVHGGLVCVDRRCQCVSALGRTLAAAFVAHHLARDSHWHGLAGVSGQRLGVLDPHYNPLNEAVLLEVATLSNPNDRACALDPHWRAEIARIIVDAIQTVHAKG